MKKNAEKNDKVPKGKLRRVIHPDIVSPASDKMFQRSGPIDPDRPVFLLTSDERKRLGNKVSMRGRNTFTLEEVKTLLAHRTRDLGVAYQEHLSQCLINERRRVVDVKNRADNKTYYCVWCEKSYSVPEITDEDEPKVVHEKRWVAIKKHVETCPMHPTHLLAEERDQRETNSTILFGVSKLVAGKLGEIVKFARANRGAVDSLAFTRLIVEAGREMERFDKTLDFLEDMEYIAYQAGKGTHKCG